MSYGRKFFVGLAFSLSVTGCLVDDGAQLPAAGEGTGLVEDQEDSAQPLLAGASEEDVTTTDLAASHADSMDQEDSILQCPDPPGPYKLTCANIWTACDGSMMTADCKTKSGTWVYTWLRDPFSCSGGVWNDDGRLRCG